MIDERVVVKQGNHAAPSVTALAFSRVHLAGQVYLLQTEDAAFQGNGDGGGPIIDAELAKGVYEVGFDRRFAYVQALSDLLVALTQAHQLQHLHLAATQALLLGLAEVPHQPVGHGRGERRAAAGGRPDGGVEFLAAGVL